MATREVAVEKFTSSARCAGNRSRDRAVHGEEAIIAHPLRQLSSRIIMYMVGCVS
jgi:hypothetical protein